MTVTKEVKTGDNPVIQLLKGLLTPETLATRIYFKGKTHRMDDPDLNPNAGVAFVREQLTALQDELKAGKGSE